MFRDLAQLRASFISAWSIRSNWRSSSSTNQMMLSRDPCACPISSLHTCVSVFGTSKIGEMLRLCYMRGMPKPPPSSIYKLYCAKQLKAGLKMADVAIMWKTKVTEAEKEVSSSPSPHMHNLHFWIPFLVLLSELDAHLYTVRSITTD
ncbi:unnamed protein product [Dicrocoelium dendriticum]|nr:unnamed protein product [Dicrocoelium dendriticum]